MLKETLKPGVFCWTSGLRNFKKGGLNCSHPPQESKRKEFLESLEGGKESQRRRSGEWDVRSGFEI